MPSPATSGPRDVSPCAAKGVRSAQEAQRAEGNPVHPPAPVPPRRSFLPCPFTSLFLTPSARAQPALCRRYYRIHPPASSRATRRGPHLGMTGALPAHVPEAQQNHSVYHRSGRHGSEGGDGHGPAMGIPTGGRRRQEHLDGRRRPGHQHRRRHQGPSRFLRRRNIRPS